MGKMINFLSILIFIDIMFLVTGQFVNASAGSVIFTAITDPAGLLEGNFWLLLVTGLSGLAIVTGVIAGLVTRSSDIAIFFVMAGTLALLITDYVAIFNYLASFNPVLALVVLGPIMILFTFVVIEWARGKD